MIAFLLPLGERRPEKTLGKTVLSSLHLAKLAPLEEAVAPGLQG